MKFAELYKDGNVKGDITDRLAPYCEYDCDEHTEGRNRIREYRRKQGVFIDSERVKKMLTKQYRAPWHKND